MPLSPVTVEQFRGLRLLPEQGEAGGAVSMLNADFTRGPTQIGTRGGLDLLVTGTATYHRISPGYDDDVLLAYRVSTTNIAVDSFSISTGLSLNHTAVWAGTRATSVARVADAVYIAGRNGAANATSQEWDSVGVTALPYKARYLAYTATERLAAAHFTTGVSSPTGADGSTSAIFFSNPADPATFAATNWIEVAPDDGEEISGMVAWRELLFVIKQSALYVFYSESIDATGNPDFLYRRIDLPARVRATHDLGGENMIVGGDGVYLVLSDGVYRTTGDVPVMISRNISPLFDGTGDSTMRFPSTAGANWTIGYAANRLFLSYTAGASVRTLVYDSLLNEWLLWDISAGAGTHPTNVLEWLDGNGVPATYVGAGANVFSLTKTATSDEGTAIVSSYQSGFEALGYPSQEKRVRTVEVVGAGTPTLTVLTDYATSDPLSRQGTVTLGTSPAVDTAVHGKAYRGRLFSYKLSATSGAWSVARLTWNVGSVRPPGLRSG